MRNIDDYNIADLEMALTSGTEETNTPPTSLSLDDVPIRDLEQAYALQKMKPQGGGPVSKEPEQSGARYLAEQFAKGAIDISDFIQLIGKIGAYSPNALLVEGANRSLAEKAGAPHTSLIEEATGKKPYSEYIQDYLKEKNVDLNTQETPDNQLLRIAGKGARAAPAGLTAVLGGPAALASGLGLATATGVGSGVLQEVGVNPLIADLASVAAVPGAALGMKNLVSSKPSLPLLNKAEQKVGSYLRSKIGKKDFPEVISNLEYVPVYKKTKYAPSTAEVGAHPALSSLYRLRYERSGSGLAEHAGMNNNQIRDAVERYLPLNEHGVDISGTLESEIKNLEKIRREAVDAGYKELKKGKYKKEKLLPKKAMNHIRESDARGDIGKDVEYARKQLLPKKQQKSLAPEEIENIGEYFSDKLSPEKRAALSQALGNKKAPIKNAPTVAELTHGREAITARLEARVRSGKKSQARELRGILKVLDEDLSAVPLHKKMIKTYEELSQPISHIKEHAGLKKALKTRLNNQVTSIIDSNSVDNVKALKKALGKNESFWKDFRGSVTDHFFKSFSNASAEGKNTILSSIKFKKYINKHGKVFKEIYSKPQLELVDEVGSILKGQNVAKSLGLGQGSATQPRLMEELGLREATGLGKATDFAARGKVKKLVGMFIKNWAKSDEEKIFGVLDRALREPEFAHKIISYNPKNQVEFNRFLNQSLRQAPLLVKGNNEERGDDELR
jgi:hypothetical protein